MYSALGVVIKKQNKGEHDQYVTLFTKEYGKMSAVSRGIRKGAAKLSGHLALLNLVSIQFALGKQHKVLTSALEVEHFSALKKELQKVHAARHITGLIEKYTISEEPDQEVFHLMLGALDYVNRRPLSALEVKFFLRYFEFKFLSLLGYEPENKAITRGMLSGGVALSEAELDSIAQEFSMYFENMYSKA